MVAILFKAPGKLMIYENNCGHYKMNTLNYVEWKNLNWRIYLRHIVNGDTANSEAM